MYRLLGAVLGGDCRLGDDIILVSHVSWCQSSFEPGWKTGGFLLESAMRLIVGRNGHGGYASDCERSEHKLVVLICFYLMFVLIESEKLLPFITKKLRNLH